MKIRYSAVKLRAIKQTAGVAQVMWERVFAASSPPSIATSFFCVSIGGMARPISKH